MTPKTKALEIYNKFLRFTPVEFEHEYTKKCALVAIELKIEGLPNINNTPPIKRISDEYYLQYWNSVMNEIKKL